MYALAGSTLEGGDLSLMSFDRAGNGLLLKTVESEVFSGFFQPIELSSEILLQHIEPIQQASEVINLRGR